MTIKISEKFCKPGESVLWNIAKEIDSSNNCELTWLGHFMSYWCHHINFYKSPNDTLYHYLDSMTKPEPKKWLLSKGIIEEIKEEKFYHVGQRFFVPMRKETYILAAVSLGNKVALIDLKTGNRWTEPKTVTFFDRITEEEFLSISGTNFGGQLIAEELYE